MVVNRTLLRHLLSAGVLLVGGGVWYSPVSPVALELADARINSAEVQTVIERYEKIARYHWSEETRTIALKRASQLCELNDRDVDGLQRLYELATTSNQLANLEAQIGLLYIEQGHYSKGALWFERAERSEPEAPEAGARLLLAAQARFESNQLAKAEKLYLLVWRKYPKLGAEADIGLAELLLSTGRARSAQKYFKRAADGAGESSLKALAQFGVATCLERMGRLDEALAEMNEVSDFPENVLDERIEGIRAHQAEYGGL